MKPIEVCFVCKERRGIARREVHEVEPTREVIWKLMDKLEPGTSPTKDLRLLEDKDMRLMLVDDVGMILQGPYRNRRGWPDVHVGFWDRILAGREEMCYTVGEILASDARVAGLWTVMPKAARATLAFAKRIGFQITNESEVAYALEISFHGEIRSDKWEWTQSL